MIAKLKQESNRDKEPKSQYQVDQYSTFPNIKQFKIGNKVIQYRGHHKVLQKNQEQEKQMNNISIKKNLAKTGQQSLNLQTIIQIGKQTIQISDMFSMKPEKSNEKNNPMPKIYRKKNNFYIIKRKPYMPMLKNKGKRKIKNCVRNIIRLFKCWLIKRQDIYSKEELSILMKIFQDNSVSNVLIKVLIKNHYSRGIFKDFLENGIDQQLNNSNIRDHKAHKQAAKSYLELYQLDTDQIRLKNQP